MSPHGEHNEGILLVFATGPYSFTLSFPAEDGVDIGLG